MLSLIRLAFFFAFCSMSLVGCEKTAPTPHADRRQESTENTLRPGPLEKIHLVEDHSQALAIWARAGVRNATVLHVDAHHDLLPAPTNENINMLQELLRKERFDEVETAGRYLTPRNQSLYGINNYLNTAYKLGIIKKIFWAYPYQGTPSLEKLQAYRDYLIETATPGRKPEFSALLIDPPFITGTLGGVPVTIGSLSDFKPDAAPLLLDIDLSFFPLFYRNPVATPYLSLLGGFIRFVEENQLQPTQTVIAFSHNGGTFPIELRYLGPWLKTLLLEPELLNQDPPTPWKVKTEAVHREYFKQFDSATELYEGLVRNYPNDPDFHFSLAMNLIALGEEDRAFAALEKARQLDPVYILGYATVAEFYNQQKEPELAIKVLERAERLVPEEILIGDALGNLHHNQGNYVQAGKYYRKVLATNHSTPMTRAYYADSLFFLGNYQEALDNYQQAIVAARQAPDAYLDPGVWLQLALTQVKLGRTDEAIATLDQFLREQPDAPEEIRTEARQQLAKLKKGSRG